MSNLSFNDENIVPYTTTTSVHSDVFNATNEKLLENTKYNREKIEALEKEMVNRFNELDYFTKKEVIALMEKGLKGDKGDRGASLQYDWKQTNLGIKTDEESKFIYVNLKGERGQDGTVSYDELTEEQRLYLKGEKGETFTYEDFTEEQLALLKGEDGLTTSISLNGITYEQEEGVINLPAYPITLPASDVYDWAKTETKPSYDASEILNMPTVLPASDVYSWAKEPTKPSYLASEIIGLPTSLPASDVYTWAKQPTKPSYSATEVGALASNGKALSASSADSATTATYAGGLHIYNEITNLKSTVVSGKQSVANAINGKLGTSLSNQTTFDDMAYYINTMELGIDFMTISSVTQGVAGTTYNNVKAIIVHLAGFTYGYVTMNSECNWRKIYTVGPVGTTYLSKATSIVSGKPLYFYQGDNAYASGLIVFSPSASITLPNFNSSKESYCIIY